MFTVYVDADACPVIRIVEKVAKEMKVSVELICDTNHVLVSDYSRVRVIGAGADAVDFALVNLLHAGDVVVTQDYGVAALALGKKAHAIHQSGKIFSDDNIEGLLMDRHLAKKARMGKGKHHLKGPKKRTEEDDIRFENAFRNLLSDILKNESIDESECK
ncbi:MAG: YaiI/YqxD family protein [Clostridia bacterium]|nr:YaiI/YqxD family protein [Clostridiales bacterium]MBQ6717105.1 YaiI/YqxD family protein [Clostridia bacterium]